MEVVPTFEEHTAFEKETYTMYLSVYFHRIVRLSVILNTKFLEIYSKLVYVSYILEICWIGFFVPKEHAWVKFFHGEPGVFSYACLARFVQRVHTQRRGAHICYVLNSWKPPAAFSGF